MTFDCRREDIKTAFETDITSLINQNTPSFKILHNFIKYLDSTHTQLSINQSFVLTYYCQRLCLPVSCMHFNIESLSLTVNKSYWNCRLMWCFLKSLFDRLMSYLSCIGTWLCSSRLLFVLKMCRVWIFPSSHFKWMHSINLLLMHHGINAIRKCINIRLATNSFILGFVRFNLK